MEEISRKTREVGKYNFGKGITMTDIDIASHAINVLNDLLLQDEEEFTKLINLRVNAKNFQYPIIKFLTDDGPKIGLTAVLNAILSILDNDKSIIGIEAEFDYTTETFKKIIRFVDLRKV